MDALHDRLAELADDAPTGGAPAAELWACGKRAVRLRFAGLAATLLVVGAAGTGVGVRLADGDNKRSDSVAANVGFALPIEYPVGEELPNLGKAPGPLAAVWLAPREPYSLADDDPGRAPNVVGLVAETGRFGTLPIDLYPWSYEAPDAHLALSPDGRRIAYVTPTDPTDGPGDPDDPTSWELVVRDLVSGEEYSPAFDYGIRAGGTWVDATHLVGHVYPGTDADGWLWDVWEPGTAPKLVNPHSYLEGTRVEPPFFINGGDPSWSCTAPTIMEPKPEGRTDASVLCDVVGVIDSKILLGHRSPGAPHNPNDLNRAVIAVDTSDAADFPFDDPALRRVVVTSEAPYPVSFATDLVGEALEANGGAS